jgi:biopolymer transport protein ExbB
MISNAAVEFMRTGGYGFMIPLMVLSVLSVAVILERLFALGRRVLPAPSTLERLRSAAGGGDRAAMGAVLSGDRSLVAEIVRAAVGLTGEQGEGLSMERAIERAANEHVPAIKTRLWILRAVGHVAPLLGLMGTVVGLAMAFGDIAEAGLSQQSVAKGISMALITTITGLGIALPTLFADYCLRAWAEQRFRAVESLLLDLAFRYDGRGRGGS